MFGVLLAAALAAGGGAPAADTAAWMLQTKPPHVGSNTSLNSWAGSCDDLPR